MEYAELGDATREHETILKLIPQGYFTYILTNFPKLNHRLVYHLLHPIRYLYQENTIL